MTGTLVSSDKPVAVFSGHRCADVPSGVGYCDYLVEQIPDVTLLGKTFHTSNFKDRARYTVRVLASQNGTTFTTIPAGLISGTLNAGQFRDVVLSGPGEFISNNPVLAAQFMHGYEDDNAGKGDPSMVLVTPAEMGVTSATFGVYGLASTQGTFMNIVTETASLANLTLDNATVDPALFTSFGGSSMYSVATIPITPGAHSVIGAAPFSALVYDYGVFRDWVSYAYPVASNLSIPVASPPASPPTGGCGREKQDDDDAESDDDS